MKSLAIILLFLGIAVLGVLLWSEVYSDYQWKNSVLSNWNLADKSSTIKSKSEYIDKFVVALQNDNLADNDALIYKTADNNCQNNIRAVSTLKDRLEEIKNMNPSSFEYQQAIQQITAQEQGEANHLLDTLWGCWEKTHWYFIWNPFLLLLWVILIAGGIGIGIGILIQIY